MILSVLNLSNQHWVLIAIVPEPKGPASFQYYDSMDGLWTQQITDKINYLKRRLTDIDLTEPTRKVSRAHGCLPITLTLFRIARSKRIHTTAVFLLLSMHFIFASMSLCRKKSTVAGGEEHFLVFLTVNAQPP